MAPIRSVSICARLTLDMHSLNNEGTEGNQQQTRMVHVIDQQGQRAVVNAVSGDMFKHILVEHLTNILLDSNQPVSPLAKRCHPDRILPDPAFREFVANDKDGNSAILRYMIQNCAVTDIAGALFAEKAAARKSCVEFGWVVGLPDRTTTEQYFHIKFDPQTREKGAGGDSVEGRQAIFHRPASSGVYALICNLDLYRIGLNDVTREYDLDATSRAVRARALLHSLAATLLKPAGAQRNTQNPHIVGCEGVLSYSEGSLPAPTVSPLNDNYCDQMELVTDALNSIEQETVAVKPFTSLSEATRIIADIANSVDMLEV